jgi:uncharacterized protein (DUF58 family)
MIQAERVASTVAQGEHGRRRVGQGDAFWQFRRFRQEDPSTAVDWRQSAKSQHLFVREREWAAAASIWIWRDASPSMHYKSHVASGTKVERATVLALAFASLLVRGGERVGDLNDSRPASGGRPGLNRFALQMTQQMTSKQSLPPLMPLPRFSQIILISDWLTPVEGCSASCATTARLAWRPFDSGSTRPRKTCPSTAAQNSKTSNRTRACSRAAPKRCARLTSIV